VSVLTGNGDQAENRLFAAQQLSPTSLRRHAPDVTITCFVILRPGSRSVSPVSGGSHL